MRRLGILGFFAIVACSGSSSDPITGPITTETSRNQASPGCTDAVELARCTSARKGASAFVCGELDQNNTLDVRSGSLENGGCDRAVDLGGLIASSLARGATAEDGRLAHISQPSSLTLDCGRYRFDSFGIDNTLAIEVRGNVVIVVERDVRIASPTTITLAPGARLDLLIGGKLEADNTLTITGGSSWVGVAGDVHVASPVRIDGSLVVPEGRIEADNTLEVGSLYAGSLRIASPLTIRGDSRIAADGCVGP